MRGEGCESPSTRLSTRSGLGFGFGPLQGNDSNASETIQGPCSHWSTLDGNDSVPYYYYYYLFGGSVYVRSQMQNHVALFT